MNVQPIHDPHHMKNLILNSSEPILFRRKLDWKLLTWSLEDWDTILQDKELNFRCGINSHTKEPQWERTTNNKKATFKDFLSFIKTENKNWMYFDYKYLKEWFTDIEELKKHIDWEMLGFPELSSEDCTIWIGSRGAHTPCHIDTYGCNLVAQIYGRKQWILSPPETNLQPTRIPYEESSIYSKLNFFSPNLEEFKGVKSCRKIILEPGDVLFVPHKWWHYVENLDTAVSINTWLPMPTDNEERLKESLVQLFITQITKNVDTNLSEIILNPNSDEEVQNMSLTSSLTLVNKCKSIVKTSNQNLQCGEQASAGKEIFNFEEYFTKYSFLQKIPKLSAAELNQFLLNQKSRFDGDDDIQKNCNVEEIVDVINAFSHPDVLSLIKDKLLQ